MKRVAIIAALPGELEPFLRSGGAAAQALPAASKVHLWRRQVGNTEVIAVWAGAGLQAAQRAFSAAEAIGPLDAAISAGWAGALTPEFQTGRAYHLCGAVDAQTGEAFPTASLTGQGWIATSHQVASSPDKARLAAAFHADLVDMEAVAIARLAAARSIPFYCIKGISDGAADHLPDFNRFIGPSGQFKLFRFILFAALRPWWWSALLKLGRQSQAASASLNLRLQELLAELS